MVFVPYANFFWQWFKNGKIGYSSLVRKDPKVDLNRKMGCAYTHANEAFHSDLNA